MPVSSGLNITHEVIGDTGYLPARVTTPREWGTGEHCCTSRTVPLHWHSHIEILYLRDDSMQAVVETENYELRSGDLLIVNTGDIHSTRVPHLPCRYLLLQISTRRLGELFPGFARLRFENLIPAEALSPRMKELLQELETLFDEKAPGFELLFTARLLELLHILMQHHSLSLAPVTIESTAGRDRKRIADILRWTEEHYREPLTLEAAAGHLGISREYFCRIFRRYTGQTYLEFLCAIRTMHFYNDLLSADDPIPQLMEANGLTNYKTFIRTFKEMYGTTPQKARQRAG